MVLLSSPEGVIQRVSSGAVALGFIAIWPLAPRTAFYPAGKGVERHRGRTAPQWERRHPAQATGLP